MTNKKQNLDPSDVYSVIKDLPRQFSAAFREVNVKIEKDTTKILFSGMGGSALPANLLKTFLATNPLAFNIPIKINRDYSLPPVVDQNWSGFFDSYSGNTEETLASLAEAEKLPLKEIVILAHAGRLADIAREKHYPLVTLPDTTQPRFAYGYTVGAMLKILAHSGLMLIDFSTLEADIEKCLADYERIETQARSLAKSLVNKTPIIYSSNIWKYLAMVWKINFNENAKVPSFWNCFPEVNHNEMVGFTNPLTDYKVIILKDPADHERTKKRMDIFHDMFADKLNAETIEMPDGSPFYKMLTTLSLGLFTSYYLALEYGIDPAPVAVVEELKKKMVE